MSLDLRHQYSATWEVYQVSTKILLRLKIVLRCELLLAWGFPGDGNRSYAIDLPVQC